MEHDTWSGKILVWATRVHCIWGSLGECASVTPIKGDGLFIHQHLSVTGAGKAVPKGHEFSGSFSTYSVTGKGAPEARDSPQTNSCRCLWLVPGWYTWKLQSLRRHGSPLKASAAESTDLCSLQHPAKPWACSRHSGSAHTKEIIFRLFESKTTFYFLSV